MYYLKHAFVDCMHHSVSSHTNALVRFCLSMRFSSQACKNARFSAAPTSHMYEGNNSSHHEAQCFFPVPLCKSTARARSCSCNPPVPQRWAPHSLRFVCIILSRLCGHNLLQQGTPVEPLQVQEQVTVQQRQQQGFVTPAQAPPTNGPSLHDLDDSDKTDVDEEEDEEEEDKGTQNAGMQPSNTPTKTPSLKWTGNDQQGAAHKTTAAEKPPAEQELPASAAQEPSPSPGASQQPAQQPRSKSRELQALLHDQEVMGIKDGDKKIGGGRRTRGGSQQPVDNDKKSKKANPKKQPPEHASSGTYWQRAICVCVNY